MLSTITIIDLIIGFYMKFLNSTGIYNQLILRCDFVAGSKSNKNIKMYLVSDLCLKKNKYILFNWILTNITIN